MLKIKYRLSPQANYLGQLFIFGGSIQKDRSISVSHKTYFKNIEKKTSL